MSFNEAYKEYLLQKQALINGLITKDDLTTIIENRCVVSSKQGLWKIDLVSGDWLWFDDISHEWIQKKAPMEQEEEDLIVTIPPVVKPTPYVGDKDTTKKECIHCQSLMEEEANFCSVCGKAQIVTKHFCTKCGTEVEKDAVYCIKCGNKH